MQHLGALGLTKERSDFPSLSAAFRCISRCEGGSEERKNRVGSKCWGVALRVGIQADKARRLVERFEWHYTPKHGSWLDMAESDLAVLTSQCLDRRIPDKQILIHQVAAWEADRNAHHAKVDWQFTTDDARIKLKRLYPTF